MNKKIVAGLCLIMVAAIGAAQTENDKSNLLTKAKAFLNRSVVHGVDTNYVENITVAPATTKIPWPYQKLRFALIFQPLPENATEFDFIVPSSTWQFKDIKCK